MPPFFTILFVLLFPQFLTTSSSSPSQWKESIDLTLLEKCVGEDVVFGVVHKIQTCHIFLNDYDLLGRIAYVESSLGESADTFRPNFYGGIWQISQSTYDLTKDVTLTNLHEQIRFNFGIHWPSTSWSDLLKPFHSGLAATLYFALIGLSMPQTLAEQATYWKNNFSQDSEDSETFFVQKVSEWEDQFFCKGQMDLLAIMDESGSVGLANFQLELQFVAKLFASYSLQNVRQGLITFSTYSRLIIQIDNDLTEAEIQKIIYAVSMTAGGTNTNLAILDGVNHFNEVSQRDGVPKILILFTDGRSGSGVTEGAMALKNFNITSFAIGAGDFLAAELLEIALGDPSHVFPLNNFGGLDEIIYRLNKATCAVPQKLRHNVTTENGFEGHDLRIYYFEMPPNLGITVLLTVHEGNVSNFYSHQYSAPSSALHDGYVGINDETYVGTNPSNCFWISISGLEKVNRYSLLVTADQEVTPPTSATVFTDSSEFPVMTTTTEMTTTERPPFIPCSKDGLTPMETDCTLYLRCSKNPVGDFWGTIEQCELGTVYCPRENKCIFEGLCPCLFP